MKKGLIFAGIGLLVVGGLGFLIFSKVLSKPGKAALQITSTPNARVFLNGEDTGKITPFFDDQLEVDEYTVKLIPEDTGEGLVPWEGKVNLVANIVTSISYRLGASEESLSGEVLSLEKIGDAKTSSLAVISQPDEGLVKINGESRGFAPVSVENLPAGEYQLTVSALQIRHLGQPGQRSPCQFHTCKSPRTRPA